MSDPIALPAEIGLGTTLSYQPIVNGTATGTVTTIGTVQDLDGPSLTWGEVEAPRLNSSFKPYRPTMLEGECSFTVQHIGADPGVQALRTMLNGPTAPPVVLWTVTYPDGYTDKFPGFGKEYQVQGVEAESIITATVSIRMTGYLVSAAPPAGN